MNTISCARYRNLSPLEVAGLYSRAVTIVLQGLLSDVSIICSDGIGRIIDLDGGDDGGVAFWDRLNYLKTPSKVTYWRRE